MSVILITTAVLTVDVEVEKFTPSKGPYQLLLTFTIWEVYQVMTAGTFGIKDCSFSFCVLHLFATISDHLCFNAEVSLEPHFKVSKSLYDLVIMVNITYTIVSHVKNLVSF
jgi:hypothetical protein